MKKYLLLLVLSIVVMNSFGQITFQRTIGGANSDIGQSIQQTTDGGYIIVGYTSSFGAGSSDVYLVKTDATGNVLWKKTYGSAGSEIGKCVRQTTDGGYIAGGWSDTFGQHGGGDFYYLKTDQNGNLLWSKTFGGPSLDLCFSCQQTADGGYAFFGWTASYGAGQGDFYLLKTDANGTVQWNKTYGWSGDDYGLWFEQTADHGYIMTGTTNSLGTGDFDVLIIKADSTGGFEWARGFGGSQNDGGSFIQQTSDGGYINAGGTPSFGAGLSDAYLIRLNSAGDTLWTRTYGNTNKDGGNCVRQDANGNFIVSGTYAQGAASQGWLFKTDGNGNQVWSRYYGGANIEDSFTFWQTNDGGYAITGQTTSFGAGMQDVYMVKTDNLGNSSCNDTSQLVAITKMPHTIVKDSAALINSGGISANAATVVNSGGIVDSLCSSTVNVPVPSFQASDSTLCANDCINFTDHSTNNPTGWQWSFPGGMPPTSTDQNPQNICYLAAGTYNVTLVASNANGSNTFTSNNLIVVRPAPPTPVITQHHDTLVCSTDPTYTSYQWFADSTLINGATDTLLIINHGGNYNIKVTNEDGCSIAVGINIVGVKEFADYGSQFTISPNPVRNELRINPAHAGAELRIGKIEIYNVLGEVLFQSVIDNSQPEIDVSGLAAGMYFLQIRSGPYGLVSFTKKFVKY